MKYKINYVVYFFPSISDSIYVWVQRCRVRSLSLWDMAVCVRGKEDGGEWGRGRRWMKSEREKFWKSKKGTELLQKYANMYLFALVSGSVLSFCVVVSVFLFREYAQPFSTQNFLKYLLIGFYSRIQHYVHVLRYDTVWASKYGMKWNEIN